MAARPHRLTVAVVLLHEGVPRGERVVGDTLLLLLNGGPEPVAFVLPPTSPLERWQTLMDTAEPTQSPRRMRAGDRYQLRGQSMAALKLHVRRDWDM